MKKIKVISLLVAVFVLLSAWVPATNSIYPAPNPNEAVAAGASIPLVITNSMPKATVVTIAGPTSYTINVAAGQTVNRMIPKAVYKFTYTGCLGVKKSGPLKMKAGQYLLPIKPCKMSTWTFYNMDDSVTYQFRLKGWMNYTGSVGPNQFKTFTFVADTYQATRYWCGKTLTSLWKMKGKRFMAVAPCS